MSNDGQFGIPSLVVVLVITGLVWKYLWPSGSSTSGAGTQGRDALSQMRQREVAVERIQQMFPQVDRRTILWDLQRNGGSIAATTEKILSGTIQQVSCRARPYQSPPLAPALLPIVPGPSAANITGMPVMQWDTGDSPREGSSYD